MALGPTHRCALEAAGQLQTRGRTEWSLLHLMDEVKVCERPVGRRRLHDVVTELRGMEPPLVAPVRRGYFRLTPAGTELAVR